MYDSDQLLKSTSPSSGIDSRWLVCRSVLDELRLKWEKKLKESGALEPIPAPAPVR